MIIDMKQDVMASKYFPGLNLRLEFNGKILPGVFYADTEKGLIRAFEMKCGDDGYSDYVCVLDERGRSIVYEATGKVEIFKGDELYTEDRLQADIEETRRRIARESDRGDEQSAAGDSVDRGRGGTAWHEGTRPQAAAQAESAAHAQAAEAERGQAQT